MFSLTSERYEPGSLVQTGDDPRLGHHAPQGRSLSRSDAVMEALEMSNRAVCVLDLLEKL